MPTLFPVICIALRTSLMNSLRYPVLIRSPAVFRDLNDGLHRGLRLVRRISQDHTERCDRGSESKVLGCSAEIHVSVEKGSLDQAANISGGLFVSDLHVSHLT